MLLNILFDVLFAVAAVTFLAQLVVKLLALVANQSPWIRSSEYLRSVVGLFHWHCWPC